MIGIYHPNVLSLISVIVDAKTGCLSIVTPYMLNNSVLTYCQHHFMVPDAEARAKGRNNAFMPRPNMSEKVLLLFLNFLWPS